MVVDDRLAIDGGAPACPQFLGPTFPGAELVGEEEEAAVVRVVRSRRLFRHYGLEFPPPPSENSHLEGELASHFGSTSALTVSSGTAALQCAVAALKLAPGDEILIPAFTFIATAAAVVLAGGVPIIVEIDDALGMDPADVERRITKRTRAILPVHMRGGACDVRAIKAIGDRHGLPLIEDVAQGAGASLGGRPLGSHGALGCYSFQFQKIITCGEGGAIVAGDSELFRRASIYSDTVSWVRHDSTIREDEIMLGMNARMPELSAALMRVQLGRLDGIVERGRKHQAALKAAVADAAPGTATMRGSHDPEGDNGTCLIFFTPSPATAEFVANALQAEQVFAGRLFDPEQPNPRRDTAVYCGWKPVVDQRSWLADGSPWSHAGQALDYTSAAHPSSVAKLARAVQVDIHPSASDEHFRGVAHALRKVLRDPRARGT
jgi:8-amino-3,8-dideoxy-alpha-D-manno-octulosonate transaminase